MKRKQIAYLAMILCLLVNAYYLCNEIKFTLALLFVTYNLAIIVVHYHDLKNIIFKIMIISGIQMFITIFNHYYDLLYFLIIIANSLSVVSFMDVYHYQSELNKYQMENVLYSIMIICFVCIIVCLVVDLLLGYQYIKMMNTIILFCAMIIGFMWEKCDRCDKIHQWEVIR